MAEPKTKKKPSVLERAIGKILGVVKLKKHDYPFAEKNMMPLISRQQAAVNELDQMGAVYGQDWLDRTGANRAIMPHTYGRAAEGALPAAVPGAKAGFSADGATYVPPATHYADPQITQDTDASAEQEDKAWMAWRDAKKRGTTDDPVGPFIERYLAQNKVADMTTEERRAYNRKITEPTEFSRERSAPSWNRNRIPTGSEKFPVKPANYGPRHQAEQGDKSYGWLGPQPTDGGVITEATIGVTLDGKETDIPLILPHTSRQELQRLQAGQGPTPEMTQKAVEWARKRRAQGLSPYAEYNERGIANQGAKSDGKDSTRKKSGSRE